MMIEKPTSTHTLGLQVEGTSLLMAEVYLIKNKPVIKRCFDVAADSSTDWPKIPPHVLTIAALPSSEVLIRALEVKLKKAKDIDEVLAFQTEPLLPYPIENAILDRQFFATTAQGTLLTVFSAKKEHVQQTLDTWNRLNLAPEVLTCVPLALACFSNQFVLTDEPYQIFFLGEAEIVCALISEGKLQASQTLALGVKNLEDALRQDKQVENDEIPESIEAYDFDVLNPAETPFLIETVEQLKKDLLRISFSLDKQVKGTETKTAFICGPGACLTHLPQIIAAHLQKELSLPESTDQIHLVQEELFKYSLPIGLALTGLPQVKDPLNFRQQEFIYPNPWKRYKKPLGIYLALCSLLAACLLFFGDFYIQNKEVGLRQEYVDLLQLMNKPYPEFEQEFNKKYASVNKVLDPNLLTQEDILERVQLLNKEIQSTPEMFPLQPNLPRVSDVLAWLTTHPNLQSTPKDPVALEHFSYTFLKRPDQTKKQERYQVKVELEFSSPTPKQAREFHDALIAPNDFVDPKGEVKWSTSRGHYRTSFILKDKTVYPGSS